MNEWFMHTPTHRQWCRLFMELKGRRHRPHPSTVESSCHSTTCRLPPAAQSLAYEARTGSAVRRMVSLCWRRRWRNLAERSRRVTCPARCGEGGERSKWNHACTYPAMPSPCKQLCTGSGASAAHGPRQPVEGFSLTIRESEIARKHVLVCFKEN